MKELSIIVTVTPINKMNKSSYRFIADSFDFTPTTEKSSAGTIINCDKEIVIELPDIAILTEFSIARSACIGFKDSSGRKIQIGTTDVPAVVSINPFLNAAHLKIESKMLKSPFIS